MHTHSKQRRLFVEVEHALYIHTNIPTYIHAYNSKQHAPLAEGGSRTGRILNLAGAPSTYPSKMQIMDNWRHMQPSILLTKAFTDVVFHDPARATLKVIGA